MNSNKRIVLTKRLLMSTTFAMTGIYLAVCAALYIGQRSLIYRPQPSAQGSDGNVMTLSVDGVDLKVSTRQHPGPKALLYFGGNAEDVSWKLPILSEAFPDHAVYLVHYRGYGGSSGRPTEKALFADSIALFDKIHIEHKAIVVIGRSLGSGVAVYLASMRPVTRLVLVTPFDSLLGIAQSHFPYLPMRWLLRDKFESWRYAPQVVAPTLIIAAAMDKEIPRASTDLLVSRFKSHVVTYKVLACTGHNSISESPEYLPALAGQP